MDNSSFFHELKLLKVSNNAYQLWVDYALSLSREDVLEMIDNGLIYQIQALDNMIREIIAGQQAPKTLLKKLRVILAATENKLQKLQ